MSIRPFPFRAASRWTALAAAAVALLFAASLRAAEPEYISLAGLKAGGFQKFLDDAKSQGYEINYVNGYDVGDHAEFAGEAIKDPAKREFEARFNMSSDEYRDWYHDMKEKGLRPTIVSGYHTKGGPRFAAVFVKDIKPFKRAVEGRHNQTQEEFEKEVTKQHDSGLEPVCVTAYQGADGAPRYTSLFYEPGPKETWANRHNMTDVQYQKQIDKWKKGGFRPMKVHVYDTPDGLRFLAIARKVDNDPYAWEARHDLTGKEYQQEFDKLGGDGYRPGPICGYLKGGELHFAAIWVKRE